MKPEPAVNDKMKVAVRQRLLSVIKEVKLPACGRDVGDMEPWAREFSNTVVFVTLGPVGTWSKQTWRSIISVWQGMHVKGPLGQLESFHSEILST